MAPSDDGGSRGPDGDLRPGGARRKRSRSCRAAHPHHGGRAPPGRAVQAPPARRPRRAGALASRRRLGDRPSGRGRRRRWVGGDDRQPAQLVRRPPGAPAGHQVVANEGSVVAGSGVPSRPRGAGGSAAAGGGAAGRRGPAGSRSRPPAPTTATAPSPSPSRPRMSPCTPRPGTYGGCGLRRAGTRPSTG